VTGADSEGRDGGHTQAGFLFLDIEGFSRSDRSEDDRVGMRQALQAIALDLLGDLGLAAETLADSNDTGDGLLCVLPAHFDRVQLVTSFYPQLTRRLGAHNAVSPGERVIRVRVVFGEGAIRHDTSTLTGPGIVGAEVNSAARLLDSAQLRHDLAGAAHRPCSLMVSERFYRSTVVLRAPSAAAAFRRVVVRAKEGPLEGWLHRPGFRPVPSAPPPAPAGTQLDLDELRPHLFVSTFDVHIFDLYRHSARTPTPPLGWQLATALLLSDGAVVHCADPYRRDEVRTVLEQYQDFVDNGEILFLLGGAVGDIRRDYRNYLENKARDYASSPLGEVDVESLEGPRRELDALGRAIDLLESSPVRVKRGYSGTARFREAVRADVRPVEEMVSGTRPLSKLLTLNLTLYQLLTLSHSTDGRLDRIVTDDHSIEAFLEEIGQILHQPIISRQIMLSAVQSHFGSILKRQHGLFDLIEARIHSLYMSATTGPHAHIEVIPRRDERSPYFWGHLRNDLRIVADEPGITQLSPAVVRELRECPQWPEFVGHHMTCVAEIAAFRLADRRFDPDAVFRRNVRDGRFNELARVLQRQYS
jgi:hypothetical protein